MAAKRETKKTKRRRAPAPKAYLINVAVDTYGNFTYTANGIPDASIIRPNNGDTISWSVTLNGIPVPFQVSFPGFGPFADGTLAVRSVFLPTTPLTVGLGDYYPGNLSFKYTVSTVNGWSDDPIVEPVPSDGIVNQKAGAQVITLSVNNTGTLTLNPEDARYAAGEVSWKWAAGQIPDDFTVTFDSATKPDHWPPSATSQGKILALNLQDTGNEVSYTLQTVHTGLSNDDGTMTIT